MLQWNPIGFLGDINNRFPHFSVQNGFEVIPRQSQFNITNFHVLGRSLTNTNMEQETYHKRLSKPSYTYLNKFEFERKY
jgi:hypothetical protein